jgi:hypothetical protein
MAKSKQLSVPRRVKYPSCIIHPRMHVFQRVPEPPPKKSQVVQRVPIHALDATWNLYSISKGSRHEPRQPSGFDGGHVRGLGEKEIRPIVTLRMEIFSDL